jgi:pimeloyl-ACP methyl ester carboxylesterase
MHGNGARSSPACPTTSRSSRGTSPELAGPRTFRPNFGLAGYATALAALVEALGAPAHVCGLSWGGTVALELYRRRPQAVATLVLADTYAGWKGSLPEEDVRARVADAERMLAEPTATGRPTFPGLFAAEPPGDVIELLDAVAADVRHESLRVTLAAMAEADLRDVLPTIDVPTLLVWGELDARSPLTVGRRKARPRSSF